jgi:hypothetical protein
MPVYLEIARLDQIVLIVARGKIAPSEIMAKARELSKANVVEFAKILDLLDANCRVEPARIERLAKLLRGRPHVTQGPVAFLVGSEFVHFAHCLTDAMEARSFRLCANLREAREWLAQIAVANAKHRGPAARGTSEGQASRPGRNGRAIYVVA